MTQFDMHCCLPSRLINNAAFYQLFMPPNVANIRYFVGILHTILHWNILWSLHRMWLWSLLFFSSSQKLLSGRTVFIVLATELVPLHFVLLLLIHSDRYMGYWNYQSLSAICFTFFLFYSWMILCFLYSCCQLVL